MWAFVRATAAKDLRRRLRDPMSLVIWLGIPFGILAMISLAFGGGQVTPQAHLLVADQDDSLVSGLLTGAFGQGPMAELFRVEAVEPDEGRERIRAGDGSALLLIPPGFGDAVLASQPTRLTLLTNPSQSILPGIVEETLSLLVDAAFYLQRLLGGPLSELAAGPPDGADAFSDDYISAVSVRFNQMFTGIGDYLFPPRLGVTIEVEEEEGRPQLNLGMLFFQSMLFLSVLFIASGMSDDVWAEARQGTLRRALTTPHGAAVLLAGKLLAGLILLLGMLLLALGAGVALYGLAPARLPAAALWAAASGMVLLLLFMLLQLYATSQRAGSILSNLALFPLMFLGGSFFPFEAMPDWLAAIGRYTPNGWALQQFKAILSGAVDTGRLAVGSATFLVLAAAAFLLARRRLRGGFVQA